MGFSAGVPRPPRLPLPAPQDAVARALVAKFGLVWPGAIASSRQVAG